MATRKKPPATPPAAPADTAHFVVLLEDMHSQFRVFGEALLSHGEALRSHREESARQFARVEQRFARVEQQFARVEQRFAGVEQRFAGVEQQFAQSDRRFASLELAVLDNGREIREVRGTVQRIESALASKVNRDEVESIVHRALGRT